MPSSLSYATIIHLIYKHTNRKDKDNQISNFQPRQRALHLYHTFLTHTAVCGQTLENGYKMKPNYLKHFNERHKKQAFSGVRERESILTSTTLCVLCDTEILQFIYQHEQQTAMMSHLKLYLTVVFGVTHSPYFKCFLHTDSVSAVGEPKGNTG